MHDPWRQRFALLSEELERQDRQWALACADLRELAALGVAVSRDVIDELDAAFAAPSIPPTRSFLHNVFA